MLPWLAALPDVRVQAEGERPFVTVAFAQSADGCLSRAPTERTFLSGELSMELTHALRATHSALVVGIGTVLSDDPSLTTRLVDGPNPRRVVLDSHLRTPVTARVLSADAVRPLLACTDDAPRERELELVEAGAEVIRFPDSAEGVSIPHLLRHLFQLGIRSVMVEGGPTTLESFFREGLVDYLCVTDAPTLIDNPSAVKLSTYDHQLLERWRPAYDFALGPDRVRAGPFLR